MTASSPTPHGCTALPAHRQLHIRKCPGARAGARPVSRAVAAERLVIGTAAFGQPYGATNTRGQVPEAIAGEVLERASALGIDTIDTAPAYGAAEALLGRLPQARRFAVVTKFSLPRETKGSDPAAAVVEGLGRSLRDLDRRRVDALLLHRGSDLLGPLGGDLLRGLRQAKTNGLADRVGVSIYDGDEVDAVLSRCRPDIVQLPLRRGGPAAHHRRTSGAAGGSGRGSSCTLGISSGPVACAGAAAGMGCGLPASSPIRREVRRVGPDAAANLPRLSSGPTRSAKDRCRCDLSRGT